MQTPSNSKHNNAVEHATLKDLIAQVEGKALDGEMKIKVMSEYVKHHVKEEEDDFP